MKTKEREIKVKANSLRRIYEAMVTLGGNNFPINTTFVLRGMQEAIRSYMNIFVEKWNGMMDSYGCSTNEMTADNPRYQDWVSEAETLLNEDVMIKVSTINITDLQNFDISLDVNTLDLLMEVGIIYHEETE